MGSRPRGREQGRRVRACERERAGALPSSLGAFLKKGESGIERKKVEGGREGEKVEGKRENESERERERERDR